jgi:hypothetical protein
MRHRHQTTRQRKLAKLKLKRYARAQATATIPYSAPSLPIAEFELAFAVAPASSVSYPRIKRGHFALVLVVVLAAVAYTQINSSLFQFTINGGFSPGQGPAVQFLLPSFFTAVVNRFVTINMTQTNSAAIIAGTQFLRAYSCACVTLSMLRL